MNVKTEQAGMSCAVRAARETGQLLRRHLALPKRIASEHQHDIKLELDVEAQKRIESILLRAFPDYAVVGEEGCQGNLDAPARWVVDPIDGTVNFTYGIPHACISIALQKRITDVRFTPSPAEPEPYRTVAGVVYDPFSDELWTAVRGGPARLNGRVIRVSRRTRLADTIVSIGFSKQRKTLVETLPLLNALLRKARKVRIMGAAALGLVYVASGRFDAYLESGIRLWDIAAGGFILERAGGEFWRRKIPGRFRYRMIASNGRLRSKLPCGPEWT